VSYPIEHLAHGYVKDLSSPVYSTSIGLLINGIETRSYECAIEKEEEKEEVVAAHEPDDTRNHDSTGHRGSRSHGNDDSTNQGSGAKVENDFKTEEDKDNRSFWDRMFNRTRDWFEASPDSDLN